jgi:2,3-dihydroxybiphenyl 1,2-dioxygenase
MLQSGQGEISALGYVGFGVADVDAWRTFAPDVLGAGVLDDEGGRLRLRLDERAMRITVEPSERNDLIYAGWEVADADALRALAGRLAAHGIVAETASPADAARRRVAGLMRAVDPSGMSLEFFHGMDAAEPFVSPRGVGAFQTGDHGLGHIVLAVDDFERTMWFYRDVLGFRVSDFIDFAIEGHPVRMGFLHCNARHHSIAFMVRPAAPRRLTHLMLEVRDLDDLGRTLEIVERKGIPLWMSLGRHTNDEMLSIYIGTPAGFPIEYGWGGRLIDDATWQPAQYDRPSVWGHRRSAPIPHPPAPAGVS